MEKAKKSILRRSWARIVKGDFVGLGFGFWRKIRIYLLTFFKKGPEKYLTMQRLFYRDIDHTNDDSLKMVVGYYKSHQKYPYEELLIKGLARPKEKIALDFGCGPGRMILRLSKVFKRVDGVDISPALIKGAKEWTKELIPCPVFFVSDGFDLAAVPSDTYDFAYSTLVFQHIAPYEVRLNLIKEIARVLKKQGQVCIQMAFTDQARQIWRKHADWLDNPFSAKKTNSGCDVRITPENIYQVEETFSQCGFTNFTYKLYDMPHKMTDATRWIFIYAKKT